jgi:hypothetical protein
MKQANEIFSERARREGWDLNNMKAFDKSDQQVRMAIEILTDEPKKAMIKAWLFGMAKNLLAPAVIDLSYLLSIERPHFFYTEGKTLWERGWNFIRQVKGSFSWVLVASMVGLAVARVVQAWGLLLLMKKDLWRASLLLLMIGYFLILSGPVGYAKYRLPYEPILIILCAIGIKDIGQRVSGRRRAVTEGQ